MVGEGKNAKVVGQLGRGRPGGAGFMDIAMVKTMLNSA